MEGRGADMVWVCDSDTSLRRPRDYKCRSILDKDQGETEGGEGEGDVPLKVW